MTGAMNEQLMTLLEIQDLRSKARELRQRGELEELEQEIVRKALAMFDGNKTRTAEYLGLSRGALYNRLAKL